MWVHSVDCHPYHDYTIMILSVWADAIHFDQSNINRSQSIQVSGTNSCPPVPGDRYNITIIPLLIMNYNLVGGLLTMQFEQVRRTC